MQIKGSAVRVSAQFVESRFPTRLDEWLAAIPADSKNIFAESILTGAWYPIQAALIAPTEAICQLFFDGDQNGALEIGEFSADRNLRGIYKAFLRLGTPKFFLDRATTVAGRHYDPSPTIELADYADGRAVVHYRSSEESHWAIETRVVGFSKRGLELSGCKGVEVQVTKSLWRGDPYTEAIATWKP